MKEKIVKRDMRNGGVRDKNADKMKSGIKGPSRGLMKGRTAGGGGREEGRDRGRGAIYLDLKGRAMGVEEDTEEKDH